MRNKLEITLNKLIQHYGFIGFVIQGLITKFTTAIPTAGVTFNKNRKFELYINPEFFFEKLTEQERMAVLIHEYYHLIHKHVIFGQNVPDKDRPTLNIAMDMAINQLIKNLPEGTVHHYNFLDEENAPLKADETTEYYLTKLKQNQQKNDGKLLDKDGKDWARGETGTDVHNWDSLSDEQKQDVMKELYDTFKRAEIKTQQSWSNVPADVKDFIEELGNAIVKIDYKKLLEHAFKTSLPTTKRINTWKKPSKRYGNKSKGSKNDEVPKIEQYADTSGSISKEELREAFTAIDGILKHSNKKCNLYLFHTDLYHKENYKIGQHDAVTTSVRSGGTDLQCVIDNINKTKPDLAFIITDGYYADVEVPHGFNTPIVFIINSSGTISHPLTRLGKTVQMTK